MKKITFDFLATMQLKEIDKAPGVVSGGKHPAEGAHIRLFSDGSLYPSKELAELHHLEFLPLGSNLPENGYDVFTSTEWEQYGNKSNSAVPFVCLALVSKHEDRVTLFSRVKYQGKEAGSLPKSSVLDQQSNAGLELIDALNKVYLESPEDSIFGDKSYVDLVIKLDTNLAQSTTGIYHIPKTVAKGKDAGKPTYIRREHISIFPVMIAEQNVAPVEVPKAKITNGAAALFGAN